MAPPEIVDWSVAARVGRAVAGGGASVTRQEARAISEDFHRHVDQADHLVRDFTGLTAATPAGEAKVLSRGAWVDANLDGVRQLIAPINEKLAASMPRLGTRRISGAAVGFQIGLLMGYVAQKVLGQYDLLLATGEAGRVYFVGPNIVAAERRHNLTARDFRLWIALHEVTHRTQFLAVPWLKEHVRGLIERYLGGIQVDAGRLRELVKRIGESLAGGPDAWRRMNLMSLFLSGEQREAVDEMQSLMTVVEGHGNFVMDRVAEKEIPTYHALREALNAQRATAGGAERAFQKLIALDMKYEQYAVGQAFLDDVHRLAGMDGVNLVWDGPQNLPSKDEFHDAESWLRRVQPQPTLFEAT